MVIARVFIPTVVLTSERVGAHYNAAHNDVIFCDGALKSSTDKTAFPVVIFDEF
jgi:hypothetical protein